MSTDVTPTATRTRLNSEQGVLLMVCILALLGLFGVVTMAG